jgi:GNAT superfamily N-acetyltransferase
MNLLRKYIRELLNEGVEFRQVDSPLEYGRSSNVKRIALCDSSVTEPAGKHDSYFAEIEKWRKYTTGRTRRKLKKPVLDEIIPGVSDVCIVGFLDYHSEGKVESGATFWYIDYMKTRGDKRGQGSARQLVEKFYETVVKDGDYVNFGKMMQPQIGHLKDDMEEKYPEIKTKGAKYF